MAVYFRHIVLPEFKRGFHLITSHILKELNQCTLQDGLCTVCIQHTSAGLTINENADPSVRRDFEVFIKDLVPEHYRKFSHTFEGEDDMPAHIKASLFGSSVSFPIINGRPQLGVWQGIYLCEFRNHGGPRNITLTVIG